MGVDTLYHCDQCDTLLEWSFVEISETTIKKPDFVHDIYWKPAPRKIFCDVTCLVKYHQYLLPPTER